MQEKLNTIKEYADKMLTWTQDLQGESDTRLKKPTVQTQITSLRQAAEKLKRCIDSPIQIGIVGEFNAGKTFLLSSLIGYHDSLNVLFGRKTLLPIDNIASTGNVTVFHFTQRDNLAETEIGLFRVKFLDESDLVECLRYMLQEAKVRAQAAGIAGDKLAGLNQLDASDHSVWDKIEPWGYNVWRSTENLSLRSLIYELVWFTRAYEQFGSLVCGKEHAVDANTVDTGLRLPKRRTGVQQLSFEDIPKPTYNKSESSRPGVLSTELLQNAFPLISRVTVGVALPSAIWNLAAVQGANPFDLLDFPGLGSMESGVRDEFLCKRELKEVQTILILLDSRTLHGKEAGNIFSMMQKDRPYQDLRDCILVGVGRFDQLDLMKGQEDILDRLNALPGPLSGQTILQKLGPLQDIRNRAIDLTSQESQIVFLSPLLMLAALAQQSKSDNASLRECNDLQEAERMRRKWAELSQRIEDSHLRRWLSDFVYDGGVSALRRLIQHHVAAHGLKQLHQRARELEAALQHEEQQLQNLLKIMAPTPEPAVPIDAIYSLQESAMEVAREFNSLKNQYQHSPPKLQCIQNGKVMDVAQAVNEETTFRFFSWSEWSAIFNQVRGGYISPQVQNTKTNGKEDPLARFRTQRPIPTRSDQLYPMFEKTIEDLEGDVRKIAQAAIREQLSQLSIRFAAQRDDLKTLFSNPQIPEELRNALLPTITPTDWETDIFEACAIKEDNELSITPSDLFPLPRTEDAKSGKTDRTFAWAPELKDRLPEYAPPDYTRHQSYVQKIRDELINSARRRLVQLATDIEKNFFKKLRKEFTDHETLWINISQDEQLFQA